MQSSAATPAGTQPRKRIAVLIVDDSALVRRMLTEMLSSDPSISVLGSAHDAYDARDKIKALNPDVLTLDVEMPRMDGLTFLRNLMRLRPMPVIMVSSLTESGAEVTLDALAIGAVDYLPKPKIDLAATLGDYKHELIGKIKAAASARVRTAPSVTVISTDPAVKRAPQRQLRTTERIHRDRRVHRRDGGDQGCADSHAPGYAGHRDHPAHSEIVQRSVRPPHGFMLSAERVRGGGRPADIARSRVHRARRPAFEAG